MGIENFTIGAELRKELLYAVARHWGATLNLTSNKSGSPSIFQCSTTSARPHRGFEIALLMFRVDADQSLSR